MRWRRLISRGPLRCGSAIIAGAQHLSKHAQHAHSILTMRSAAVGMSAWEERACVMARVRPAEIHGTSSVLTFWGLHRHSGRRQMKVGANQQSSRSDW